MFLQTLREARARAAGADAVLVAFSGGKDSLAVLDLCLRVFSRVEAFHWEFVPGLDYTRERVLDPLARLGVPCRLYDDPLSIKALKHGTFCDPWVELVGYRVPTEREMYEEAIDDTGIPLVATGKKKSDYRQRAFHMNAGRVFGWHPLRDWRKADVLSYLKVRGITPPTSHADAGGIDLTAASLTWLRATYPGDFQKLLAYYPYAELAILRAEGRRAAEEADRPEPARGPGRRAAADPLRKFRSRRRAAGADQERPVQPPADHGRRPAEAQEEHRGGGAP